MENNTLLLDLNDLDKVLKTQESLTITVPPELFVPDFEPDDEDEETITDKAFMPLCKLFAVAAICPQHTFLVTTPHMDYAYKFMSGNLEDEITIHIQEKIYGVCGKYGVPVPERLESPMKYSHLPMEEFARKTMEVLSKWYPLRNVWFRFYVEP